MMPGNRKFNFQVIPFFLLCSWNLLVFNTKEWIEIISWNHIITVRRDRRAGCPAPILWYPWDTINIYKCRKKITHWSIGKSFRTAFISFLSHSLWHWSPQGTLLCLNFVSGSSEWAESWQEVRRPSTQTASASHKLCQFGQISTFRPGTNERGHANDLRT